MSSRKASQPLSAQKIAFYNHTGEVSGAEIVLLSILDGLDRSRYVPVLLCPEGDLVRASNGVPHRGVPLLEARFTSNPSHLLRHLGSAFNAIRRIRAAIRAEEPSLVHANSVRAGLVATFAAAGLGLPVVWHLHDILPRHAITTAIRLIARLSSKTTLLAVSHATANSFLDGSATKPVTVVYNSVDVVRFQPDPCARARVRQELDLAGDHVAIGVIGQIAERKGQLELVEAFSLLRDRMPRAVLLIVGSAQFNASNRAYAATLSRRIQQLHLDDQVRMLGKRRDIPDIMNAVDLLAQNSSVEPLGMALLEGFACGRTAAATGVDGVKEIIDDGLTGILSIPGDPSDLVRRIESLVRNPDLRIRMGQRARVKVATQFNPALQMARMHQFYDQLLGISAPAEPKKALA